MLNDLRKRDFDVVVKNHAEAILSVEFPQETADLVRALTAFPLPVAELIGSGGGEALSSACGAC